MFEVVNEVAVIGTTFFMVALATLWYSEYLFQKPWMNSVGLEVNDMDRARSRMKHNFVITFCTYAITIFFLALASGYAQMFDLSVQKMAVSIALGFSAFMAGFVVWEQRSATYYFITAGFGSIFIIASMLLLYYWPW